MKPTTRYEMIPQDQRWGWVMVCIMVVLTIISFCATLVFMFIFPNPDLSITMSQFAIVLSMMGLLYSYWLYHNAWKAIMLK